MKRFCRVLILSLVLGLIVSACGGDDDDGEQGQQEEQAASPEEFCNAYVAAQAAVIGASQGGDPSQLTSLLDRVESTAPEEVADTVAELVPQVREAMETQDQSIFESEEFTEGDEELDGFLADDCGFEAIDVTAMDYAFEGIPATLTSGNVTINWTNEGPEVHEMILVRFRDPNATLEDLLELSDQQAQRKIEFKQGFFGEAGTSDTETIPLEPGKYAAVCFLPVGATDLEALRTAKGPPHVTEGMGMEFTVE